MERMCALPMQHLMATVILALALGLAFMLEHKFQELEEELVYLKRNYKTLETECDMLKSKVESYEHVFSKENGSLKEQVRVIQTDVGSLKIQMENLKQAALNTGSWFTRWGRSDCPATSTLIYKVKFMGNASFIKNSVPGNYASAMVHFLHPSKTRSCYTGGSWYNHKGAASNFLCLPENPQWGTRSLNNFQAFVYGAEYENNFFGGNAHQQDVPCSVCKTKTGTNSAMIPARTSCYDGWTIQYKGYLGAGFHNHLASTEYVCVDENIQFIPGGYENKDGKLIYPVVAKCGSLRCHPYIENKPIACVVCSY